MSTTKYMNFTTSEDAKTRAQKFNDSNIKLNGNEIFKFLNVHFDAFATSDPNVFRIGALVYSSYQRYCWLILTERLTVSNVSEFLVATFHDFLRRPENTHFIQQLVAEHALCSKEEDALNLVNPVVLLGRSLARNGFIVGSSKMEAEKEHVQREKRDCRLKKWKKRAAKNVQMKKRVDELEAKNALLVDENKTLSGTVSTQETFIKSQAQQFIHRRGVEEENARRVNVLKTQVEIISNECIALKQIISTQDNVIWQQTTLKDAQHENTAAELKKVRQEKENASKQVASLQQLLKESNERVASTTKELMALYAKTATSKSTAIINELEHTIYTLRMENGELQQKLLQCADAKTFEKTINWANNGLSLSTNFVYTEED